MTDIPLPFRREAPPALLLLNHKTLKA